MGVYVYSLRKKHVEAKLDGIYPVDVVAYQYAYKESYCRKGEYRYAEQQRMAGRVSSLAQRAREHYYQRARDEHGTTQRNFYFAMGGLDDGAIVYELYQCLPTAHYDNDIPSRFGADLPAKAVGRLFKVGRGQWIVSEICPEHIWRYYTEVEDGIHTSMCERCDSIKDPRFNSVKVR